MSKQDDNTILAGCGCLLIILLFIGVGIGWFFNGFHYSDGYRDGTVQKFSEKGIVWTTGEGELIQLGFRARNRKIESNTFEFSVLDSAVAKGIEEVRAGEEVRLHYEQYLCSPPWKGSTQYRVWKVEKLP
jgi:hypothetical protein